MNKKYIELLLQILEDYSDVMGNNGCNDFWFPKNWTDDDVIDFKTKYMAEMIIKERKEEISADRVDYDYAIVAGLKNMIRQIAKEIAHTPEMEFPSSRRGELVNNVQHLQQGDYVFIKEYKVRKPMSTIIESHNHENRSIRIDSVNVKYGLVRYELADRGYGEMGAFSGKYLNCNGDEKIVLQYMD